MTAYTLTQIARALLINLEENVPTIIVGAVGVGKTDVVRQCADRLRNGVWQGRKLNVLVIDKRASQMEPTDIAVPMPDIVTRTVITCLQEWLPNAADAATYDIIILLFDELSDASPAVQAALNQLILERELPGYRLPENVRIVATGNRQIDRGNAQKFNRATSNRMSVFEVMIDPASLIVWLNAHNMPEISAFVQSEVRTLEHNGKPISEAIHQYPEAGSDAQAFLTSRSLARCDKYIKRGLNDIDLAMMCAANIGDKAAERLMQFLATYRLLPDLNAILADPMNAPITRESGTNFALVVALCSRLTLTNIGTVVTYINRLSPAYRAAFWSNATSRDIDPETGKSVFAETAEYVSYKVNLA